MRDKHFNVYGVWKNLEKIMRDIKIGKYNRAVFETELGTMALVKWRKGVQILPINRI
ncbi:hypothetical protein KBC75_04920 [Candidatus Shapirobacteria bacterium]|nr:hypothetical protein [Candidatus Shapirobacteria bacterium]